MFIKLNLGQELTINNLNLPKKKIQLFKKNFKEKGLIMASINFVFNSIFT